MKQNYIVRVLGTILIPIVVFVIIYQFFKCAEDSFGQIETVFKVLALYAAFCFFLYKLFTGWLIINLTVDLKTERKHKDSANDHLSISVNIDKGATDSVWIKDIQLKVCGYGNGASELNDASQLMTKLVRPIGFQRAKLATSGTGIIWKDGADEDLLNISPGEQTTFTAYTEIPAKSIVTIEALILGTRPFYDFQKKKPRPIQWKASAVVLPGLEKVGD